MYLMSVSGIAWVGLAALARLAIGGLLVVAARSKVWASSSWRREWLRAYRIVPSRLVPITAWGVAATELVVGVATVMGAFGCMWAVAAAVTFLVLTVVVCAALLRGLRVPCGCLGDPYRIISWRLAVLSHEVGDTPGWWLIKAKTSECGGDSRLHPHRRSSWPTLMHG